MRATPLKPVAPLRSRTVTLPASTILPTFSYGVPTTRVEPLAAMFRPNSSPDSLTPGMPLLFSLRVVRLPGTPAASTGHTTRPPARL